MHVSRFLLLGPLVVCALACGGQTSSDTAHAAGGTAGSAGNGGGGASGTGGSSTAQACGGGLKGCAPDHYCDFGATDCGANGEHGVCKLRPTNCGVCDCLASLCGCDGKLYETDCAAHAAGVDISASNSCAVNPNSCDGAASLLAAKFQNPYCTTTLRLDPENQFAVAGFAIYCGPNKSPVDEATARATAFADTGFGSQCGSQILATAGPPDEVVIFHPTSYTKCACCGNGWVAAVSAASGLSVLGVDIPLGKPAQVTFPKPWDPPSDLASGCQTSDPVPPAHGWNLGGPFAPSPTASELDSATVSSALSAVYTTALPLALQKAGQHAESALVLQYVRNAGEDLVQNDVIVLLNSVVLLD